ncbi:hypothetical protein O6R05_06250 [Peptoniphilus equinus]|uniref:DUF3221 domain-containing protein n=1 Tax=Peptoniphilus equinus TaxID=3016343 RepID=A0ABY7QS30_9FIRM|nr:hypothetical protein [Peptoniphilus equinus]WBW49595.1 hypothetical protein O6R05_06250 [Peptoniphilus equinus]
MKKIVSLFMLSICMMGLAACNDTTDTLHLGVNAAIAELDTERLQITVNGTDADSFLGEGCVISCDDIPMIYYNYKSGEVKQISIQDLQVGDNIILGIRDSEINHFLDDKGTLNIEQLQLGTQRLN